MPNAVYDDEDTKQDFANPSLEEMEAHYKGDSATTPGSEIAKQNEAKALKDKVDGAGLTSFGNTGPQKETGTNPSWYTGGEGKNGKKKKGWWTKPKAAAAAGIVTSVLGLSAFVVAPLTGPLEFIHFAQSIQLPHFGAQEDAADGRLNRLLRYARTRDVGQTRISYLESKYLKRITADMEKAGFKADFDRAGYKGMYIDVNAEKSPYKDMTPDEVDEQLKKDFPEGSFETKDGKYYLNEHKSYWQQHKIFIQISKKMGYKGVTGSMRARPIQKFGVVSWNPLTKIDKAVNRFVIAQWKKAREAMLKDGVKAATVDTSNAAEEDKESKTKTPMDGAGPSGELTEEGTKSTLKSLTESKGAKITGGLAAVAGILCAVRDTNDQVGQIKYVQVVKPLMRQGFDIVTAGNQVMSGQGFDDAQLELYSTILRGKDKDGRITDWSKSESIQANNGGSGGVPLDPKVQELLTQNKIAWLNWIEEPSIKTVVDPMCSTAGTIIVGSVSVAVGVATGGAVSTIVGALVNAAIAGPIMDKISSTLAGNAVDVSVVGAQLGAQADIGAKLGADLVAMQSGGDTLSTTEAYQLREITNEADMYAFGKLPLKDRLFDATNRHSLLGKLVDASPNSTQELGSTIGSLFTGSFSRLASGMGTFTKKASAQSLDYDYGLPKFGYSMTELADSRFADPYANAEKAAQLFDSPQGSKYIDKALACYGVAISKTAEGWGALTQDDAYQKQFTGERDASNCQDRSDENWMRTRFFIFDMGVMESYACLQGESQSCQNSGFGAQPAATAETATAGKPNIADLSKESVSVPCATGTKDIGVMDGYSEGKLVKIRLCAITGFKNIAGISRFPGDGGYVAVNSRLSAAWYALAQKAADDGIRLEATSGFRTMEKQQELYSGDPRLAAKPGYSNHQMGLAIDVAGPSSKDASAQTCAQRMMDLDSPVWVWLNNNTAKYGIQQYSAEAWHWDPNPGGDIGNRCGGDGSLRS